MLSVVSRRLSHVEADLLPSSRSAFQSKAWRGRVEVGMIPPKDKHIIQASTIIYGQTKDDQRLGSKATRTELHLSACLLKVPFIQFHTVAA